MDVGNPSNFVRMLDLYDRDFDRLSKDILSYSFSDEETRQAMKDIFTSQEYVLDPHGAIGYLGLKHYLKQQGRKINGVFFETAHPGKFRDVVEGTIAQKLVLPERLKKFLSNKKVSTSISKKFDEFKRYLLR